MRQNIVILVGRSGSGKGTQGVFIKEFLEKKGLTSYISTGARFRNFVSKETHTSSLARKINDQGGLQPEFLAVWNWADILIENISGDYNIIFDGAPRKLHEAEVLDSAVSFYGWERPLVIEIDVSLEECTKRLLARKRSDDNEEVIKERLSWYDRDVVPTIDWYKNHSGYVYKKIDGNADVETIKKEIEEFLRAELN
jgi:adenylate kinase